MTQKRFYVTIEVTAQMSGDTKPSDLRGRIIDYIHNENQKKNHVNSSCYLHREWIMSINDEKGNEV